MTVIRNASVDANNSTAFFASVDELFELSSRFIIKSAMSFIDGGFIIILYYPNAAANIKPYKKAHLKMNIKITLTIADTSVQRKNMPKYEI